VGGAAFFAAWGEPSRPGFPRRGNGKGASQFLAAAGDYLVPRRRFLFASLHSSPTAENAMLPFALLVELSFRCLLVSSIFVSGAAISVPSLPRQRLRSRGAPPRPRSHPNSAICLQKPILFMPLPALP